MQAIANGHVANSVVITRPQPENANAGIKLLGQDGRVFDLGQTYSGSQGGVDPEAVMTSTFEQARLELLAAHSVALESAANGNLAETLRPGEDAWRLGAEEIARRLGEKDSGRISDIFVAAEQTFITPAPGNRPKILQLQAYVQRVAAKLGISPLQVTMAQMKLLAPWGSTDQFSINLPLLFGKYRDALVQNRLLQMSEADLGTASAMSEEVFIASFGSPPWDQINETLAAFGLPYEVTPPSLFNFDPVTVNLKKVGSEQIVGPQNLSSGEKVLLQFAVSSFHYDDHFISVSRPKILLLDEMDASLHPEMINRWLGAVQHGLVEAQGLHCIITTHSPTTVALAPDESLFEMKNGRSGLAKISKQNAINGLTFGVPTLSINYSGRRQVFAESDTDAAIYESIYAIIKAHTQCERELNFLSTGLRDKNNGEFNAGCAIVKKTVDRLAELDNSSIFGIVDWDGEAISTDRIKVVAGGERNGIENVLLDPLLVALLLMKERRLPEGLQDIDRFTGAQSLERPELQRLIDAIQIAVFPDGIDPVEVSYLGGAKANVLRTYLEADDHALETALAKKFPALNKWTSRGRGELMKAVIEHVLSEHTFFCPVALPIVFEAIANAPA
ncbi:AAA family ATPase [uncultured Sphingobium sp.]|uniref:AAA family ATPase n=1 Tax=uncultured Sphingobium sp. TaxID=316087 RepID=UPI00260258F8|nr:AAA family ATPase [uncultured Sphingobium sp.]